MGSMPLPALSIRPPENPLDQYAKALSVQSMIAGQRTQQLQQTGLTQENQLRQQTITDQQATTKAMQEWDGKDFNALVPLAVKHGASSTAVIGLKNNILGQQEKLSTMAKNDAETGSKVLETTSKKNDMALGALQAATGVPDEELFDSVKKAKNTALLGGYIDKPHADALDQLLATNDPVKLRSALAVFEKGLMGQKAQFDQAEEERKTTAAEWKEFSGLGALVNTRTGDVKQIGGGVMTPGMMESRYVTLQAKKSGGQQITQDDQNFIKGYEAMKKLVPQFTFNLQAGGASDVPLNANQKATADAIIEGRMAAPGSFALKTPYWQTVMGSVFQQDPQWNEQRAQLRKAFTVGKQSTEINAINTAMGHVGVLGNAIEALNNNNVKILNSIANAAGVQIGADPVTTFNTIVHRVGPEIAKAYIGAGGSAGERGSDEKDFDPSLGPQQLRSNVSITAKLLRSKISSLENQWDQNKSDSMPSFQDRFIMPEAQAQLDKWAPKGGGGGGAGQFTVKAGGKTYPFSSQAAADAFRAAVIKAGGVAE